MPTFIHQIEGWPKFYWDERTISPLLAAVSRRQGRLVGRMEAMGFELRDEAVLETLTEEVHKSSEIEGEVLDKDQVRSSIARRLGINIGGLVPSDRNVDGVVEMMIDATQNFAATLSEDRLYGWHSALFPTGRSGLTKITVGAWRDDDGGPMQVVSGAIGKERVHFQAPAASCVDGSCIARSFSSFRCTLVWYCPVSGLFTRFSSAGPYGFREPSPIPTFGLFMSMTLVGLLRSRADPDYHKLNSSLQVS